jgi:hypothetical protein
MYNYIKILESRIGEIVDILNKKPNFNLFGENMTENSFKKDLPNDSFVRYKSMNTIENDKVLEMIKEMKNKVGIK